MEVIKLDFTPMEEFMDRLTTWRIPGNVVNIYKDNQLVFEYCSGYSDIEAGERMTPDKNFFLYSCSKITTTLAALQLYEKGYYLLDNPLYEFIPEFRELYIKNADGSVQKAKEPVTIRHLFTMTAGFNYDFSPLLEAENETQGHFHTVPTIKRLASVPLDFEPGTHFQYSLCHDVLAAFTEIVAGKKFRDYVRENIFEPCGMTASYVEDKESVGKCAVQYRFINDDAVSDIVKAQQSDTSCADGYLERAGQTNTHILGDEYDSGGAGIIASVPEYAKLMAAIANGGLTKSGERILTRGTIELWRTNQLSQELLLKEYNWPQMKGYGYGLGVRTMMDRALSGSNGAFGEIGWGGAAGANALIDVENNVSFFYAHHMLNNQEAYVQPRLRNVFYTCLTR